MKKEFEVFDDEDGFKVMGAYYNSDLKEYPFLIQVPKDADEEVYLSPVEAYDLYLFLEDIFGKKAINLINE